MRYARWSPLIVLAVLSVAILVSHAQRFLDQPFVSDAPGSPATVFGEVHDDQGLVAGASIRFQGAPQAVLTDAAGRFHLDRRPQDSARLTAWKKGYLIAGATAVVSPVSIRVTSLPSEDDEHYTWVDPEPDAAQQQNCGNCHADIHREWSKSGHARAVSDRHFLNLYEGSDWRGRQNIGWSLLAEHPDGAGVCTACHAPTVAFADPAYFDLRKARGPAARGVHCDYCHKVADVANLQPGLTHGRFGLQLLRPAKGQLFFGPLDDVDRGEDVFAPIYRESRYCASCHEGTVFGVPVYSTYSEWLASPARDDGKQCQTCHMTPTGKLTNVAAGKGGVERDPNTLSNHRFFAYSQVEMLKRCLKVDIRLIRAPGEVRAEVEVKADQVGHRVPTGFADRNLLLVVEGFAEDGPPIAPLTGPLLPPHAGKSLAGRPGRLYAKQLRDFDGHKPAPFWRAQPNPEDSRLVPGQPDRSSYGFPAELGRVRLRLLYRRFWEDVAVVKDWPDNETKLVEQTISIEAGREVRWSGP
jgi:hypothetical protein